LKSGNKALLTAIEKQGKTMEKRNTEQQREMAQLKDQHMKETETLKSQNADLKNKLEGTKRAILSR